MLRKLCTKIKHLNNISVTKRWDSIKIQTFYDKDTVARKNVKLFPKATYGGSNIVTLICASNQASRESTEYLKEILYKVNAPIIFEEINPHPEEECNGETETEDDKETKLSPMDALILSFQRNRIALMTDYRRLDNIAQHERIRMSGTLRLFVAIMKFFPFPGFESKGKDYDITLVGGNVVSDHTGLEYEPIKGMVETLRICNERSVKKFIKYTYDYAAKHKHREITFVHKVEHFELSDGYFIECAEEMHKKYPNIQIETMPVNALALNLVINPRRFDIISCSERYTNTIASIIGGICGGVDLFCVNSYGLHHALFQPLENRLSLPLDNDATEMAPYGVISACVQLLLHLGYCESGTAIWKALIKTMIKDEIKTKQYCGSHSAVDVYCKVLGYLNDFKIV